MPRNARLAVLFSFLLHGGLILAARYRLSYDAYNHMFFGDHYRMDWWSLWEARWYTGFCVNSYPPLVHQLLGALSQLIGLDAAFALILWVAVTLLPLAVYAFARVFVGNASAGYAALGAACLPSVYLTAHIFGQLPTLAATITALLLWLCSINIYVPEADLTASSPFRSWGQSWRFTTPRSCFYPGLSWRSCCACCSQNKSTGKYS
jgi:uncharacterized membrane protein